MLTNEKEVRFDLYCKSCVHKNTAEDKNPCDECLSNPTNTYSEKPLMYEKEGP